MPRSADGAGWSAEARDRGAEVRRRVVPELDDERMVLEGRLDDAALDAAAAAVDEAHLAQAGVVRGVEVIAHDRGDIFRTKRVQVDLGLDRQAMDHFLYSAMTVVVMPPRALNAPVTRIDLGRQAATRSFRIPLVAAS